MTASSSTTTNPVPALHHYQGRHCGPVRDRVILANPCEGTELPKIPPRKQRILTPEEYQRLIGEVPDRYELLVMTDSETGLRCASSSPCGPGTSTW